MGQRQPSRTQRGVIAALVAITVLAAAPPAGRPPAHASTSASVVTSPGAAQAQQGELPFFPETGFRLASRAFADYFARRGGLRTFGYPVSNGFRLLGSEVQFFQRQVMQVRPDGSVGTLNLLDADVMPITRVNGAIFPASDPEVLRGAPAPGAPGYDQAVLAFIAQHTPDEWNGLPVGFRRTFLSTVRYEEAFPERDAPASLIPAINLELWGLPTSRPAADPGNAGFAYLRFQRGVMHYDASTGATQGLLLADYLKAIITGQNLPADLDEQARTSRFYRQYDPSRPQSLARPEALPGTDLTGAFALTGQSPPAPEPGGAAEVPGEYRALYDTLKGDLDEFGALLARQQIARHAPLVMGAELSAANCNNGPRLLAPDALDAVRLQLDALRRLGAQGATFCIHYPLLYPGFPRSDEYLTFYTAVAREVRARGMTLAIDSQTIFSGSAFSNLTVDFSDLTFDVYADRKAAMAQRIIDSIAPDYLSLGGEPDTEARLTGIRDLADPARHTAFFQRILAKVDRKSTKLGGGSGTWLTSEFVRSYAANTSLDFIDLHVYPISDNIHRNTIAVADLARRYGKRIVVYESWLYKSVGQEASVNVAAAEHVFARDAFDFWEPLDRQFMSNMVALADWKQLDYLSFFWTVYFYAYERYGPDNRGLPPADLLGRVTQRSTANMRAARPTGTGAHYAALARRGA